MADGKADLVLHEGLVFGRPGLNGFVGEFLILLGTFFKLRVAAVLAVLGVVLGALYMLWAYERVSFGAITREANRGLADLSPRELLVMVPMLVLVVVMGLYPGPFLRRMEPSVEVLLGRVRAARLELAQPVVKPQLSLAAQAPLRGKQVR